MALSINTNLASMNAQRNQTRSASDLSTAIARLSSGLRINSAKDDAAGLAIADRFTSQIRGTVQAGRNANDGISLAQTAEGSLASIGDNLQRIRELSVQSANATNSASDRASLQLEVSQLQSEIDRVASQTQFNGINLLDGSFTAKAFQVGANVGQTITTPALASARTAALGTHLGVSVSGLGPGLGAGALQTFSLTLAPGATINLGTLNGDTRDFAAALNAAQVRGLTARADPTVVAAGVSTATASASGVATLTINGVPVLLAGTSGGPGLAGNRSTAVAAINVQSAATGVQAIDTGSGVSLLAADGRNVALAFSSGSFTGSTSADFGLTSTAVTAGTFSIDYTATAGVTGLTLTYFFGGGFSLNYPVTTIGTPVSAIDISTAGAANAALASIDSALATVSSARASLGAVQNRFTSTIGNLQSAGENLSASRGRIQDADFAAETANLSRAQVLQQAGTAMIAQANQAPGQVLALAQGELERYGLVNDAQHQHQPRLAQRAAQPEPGAERSGDFAGPAVVGLSDQRCQRRCRRARHRRPLHLTDSWHHPGRAQRQRRHLAGADGRGRAFGDQRQPAANARARGAVEPMARIPRRTGLRCNSKISQLQA